MLEDPEKECPLIHTLNIIGRKWMAFILSELLVQGEVNFSQFLKHVQGKYGEKISGRVLSNNLSILEENEIIARKVSQEMPVRVYYSLTEKGEDLAVIFGALKGWGTKWGGIKHKQCRSFTCIHNGVPILNIKKARELLHWTEILDLDM
ncbi:MAG: winged helix-turn-helix transcriptional regulator [Candidatus Hodarchaeota archaeon]